MQTVYRVMNSPVGKLKLVANNRGLLALLWNDGKMASKAFQDAEEQKKSHPILDQAENQLKEYFRGARTSFSLKLDLQGTTFQKKVWQALLTIPFGETRSYGQIAVQVGSPRAVRAVGGANGRNPISIIVPCHRVIGASGHLTGFGGGLKVKSQLLELEKRER